MQCSSHSGITLKDGKRIYLGCLGGHSSSPANGAILDSDTNSKQPVKEEILEITCWIIAKNYDDSLEDDSVDDHKTIISTRGLR